MATQKIAYLTIQVVVESDDPNINLDDVISDLDYEITFNTDGAKIVDTCLLDREIKE